MGYYQEMIRVAQEYFTLVREPEPNKHLLAELEHKLIGMSNDTVLQVMLELDPTDPDGYEKVRDALLFEQLKGTN